jgi:hypothetical protein
VFATTGSSYEQTADDDNTPHQWLLKQSVFSATTIPIHPREIATDLN